MKQKCFFAYCWDDTERSPERILNLIDYLKKRIEGGSNETIRVTIDKKDFHVSENFKENEKKILNSDSVVIFFSTAYKQIVDEADEKRGVYREYKHILEAYNDNKIAVIPIVVEGDVNKVITREFKDNIAADFSKQLPVINGKNNRKKLNPSYKTTMTNLISDIIYETAVANRRKDYVFSSIEEAYSVLFCNTDSKNKLPRACMYKSEAYINIMNREKANFLIGRKGSGKTTFFEILEKYNPSEFDEKFKVLRPISVEDIRESYLYSIIEKQSADNIIFGEGQTIELFWEIYLYLCAIYIVCVEEENHRIRDERRGDIHKITNKLKKVLKVTKLDSNDVKRAIFTESAALWEKFLKSDILDYATEEAYLASMDANFNVDNVMSKLFGKTEYKKFVKAINQCDKEILIALDNFDTISDDFRRQVKNDLRSSNQEIVLDAQNRSKFDMLLYRSLVNKVIKIKSTDNGIMGKTAFCIIIPQDRIDKIRLCDRDFDKKKFTRLSWDAVELLEVILLRLKELYKTDIDYNENLYENFESIMIQNMHSVPMNIAIEVDGKTKHIGLFQYLLRNSFWRPRDIIKYISVLYDANSKNMDKHKTIDMYTLKSLLNNVTEDIIENEFYAEYENVFYNIRELLSKFRNKNIIMSISELIDVIECFEFEGIIFEGENIIQEKIIFMYEIGIIGLIFEEKYKIQNMLEHNTCFIFNEGLRPIEKTMKDIENHSKDIQIVLNPIFSKNLTLHYNTIDIICNYDWNYLMNNHIRKAGIDRI